MGAGAGRAGRRPGRPRGAGGLGRGLRVEGPKAPADLHLSAPATAVEDGSGLTAEAPAEPVAPGAPDMAEAEPPIAPERPRPRLIVFQPGTAVALSANPPTPASPQSWQPSRDDRRRLAQLGARLDALAPPRLWGDFTDRVRLECWRERIVLMGAARATHEAHARQVEPPIRLGKAS